MGVFLYKCEYDLGMVDVLEFVLADGWLHYLYKRMDFVQNTSERPVLIESLWIEIDTFFWFNVCTYVGKYHILDKLIKSVCQAPSKYVATSNATTA